MTGTQISRVRSIRGGGLFALGGIGTFLLMANASQLWHGPLWGFLTMALALVGLVDLLGLLTPASAETPTLAAVSIEPLDGEALWQSPKVGVPAALAIVLLGGPLLGYAAAPYIVVASLLALLPAAMRRPGLFAFIVACGIMLPMLGVFGLWDPWETHYGEVAREILSRDDWISLWWAQEDWFWSKPIFIFWANALTMGALGVDFHPDANPGHPEWALRLPLFLVALVAVMATYHAIARVYGKRAGMITAIVLATMPHFFLLSHQAITDMYFVGNMTTAMAFFIIAVTTGESREVRSYRLGPVEVSVKAVLVALVSGVALAQILYLASRNLTLLPEGFAWHGDRFLFGSAGNDGVPGNKPLGEDQLPAYREWFLQPFAQAVYWAIGLAAVLYSTRKEKTVRGLAMLAFYVFCAFAFMSKGIPGFALPGLVALLFLVASGRWKLLFDGHLRIGLGILTVAVVGLPWFVAMYMRHGTGFTDRLLIHDHLNRLASGVHGDNGTIQYFLSQLGYGMFPWVALAPAALTLWLRVSSYDASDASLAARAHRSLHSATGAGFVLSRSAALRDAGMGGAFIVLGLVFTIVKLSSGTSTPMLVVAWSAMALGLVLLLRGLFVLVPSAAPSLAVAGGALSVSDTNPDSVSDTNEEEPVDDEKRARLDTAQLAGLWFAAAFTLFSAMVTKFHHYIFPAVPPTAILVGLLVDRMIGGRAEGVSDKGEKLATVASVASAVLFILGVAGLVGDPRGVAPFELEGTARTEYVATHPWPVALSVFLILAAIGAGFYAVKTLRGTGAAAPSGWKVGGLSVALATAPVLAAFVGRDLAWVTSARPAGYERLIHLFVYNYSRPWPDVFDYRPILTGFAAGAVVLLALGAVDVMRSYAMRAFLGLAVAFAVWTLDVYIVDLSPHWSQRDVIQQYYVLRADDSEPLLAYQMNWKGENFYTGNRVHVFQDLDTTKLREWITAHPRTRFFVALEHSRLEAFKNHVRDRDVTPITGMRENNKFLMIQVSPR